jgi:hypothetical protein
VVELLALAWPSKRDESGKPAARHTENHTRLALQPTPLAASLRSQKARAVAVLLAMMLTLRRVDREGRPRRGETRRVQGHGGGRHEGSHKKTRENTHSLSRFVHLPPKPTIGSAKAVGNPSPRLRQSRGRTGSKWGEGSRRVAQLGRGGGFFREGFPACHRQSSPVPRQVPPRAA